MARYKVDGRGDCFWDQFDSGPNQCLPAPPPPPPTPMWLQIVNQHFVDDQGQRWIWRGVTDFLLFQRFLREEDVRPIIRERMDHGATVFRFTSVMVFLPAVIGFETMSPDSYAHYWTAAPDFLNLLESEGAHGEVTVFTDMQMLRWSLGKQREHWSHWGDLLRGRPHFAELVNEYSKNAVDPSQFGPLPGVICSRGSGESDRPPARPCWQFFGWHGRRTPFHKVPSSTEDMYPIAHSLRDGWNSHTYAPSVAVHDEPMGFGPVEIHGKRSTSPTLAMNLATASKELGDGGTFHSDAGCFSLPWSETERRCARAFFAGLDI